MRKKILFICGSLNQTTMMHQISRHFNEYDCYFTPYYLGENWESILEIFLDFTIIGGKYRASTEDYLYSNNLKIDYKGLVNSYDFVFTCQDIIIQNNISNNRIFLVQEGMTDPERLNYKLVKYLGFPRWVAGTAATGLSDMYQLFFVASPGYRNLFISKGINPEKINVTGIPNFDNVKAYLQNDFPYHNYVLAATSNLRECFEFEDRKEFILKAKKIAGEKQLIFKLHPAENEKRATREIQKWAPNAFIFTSGNTNHMIANCDTLVTRYSSVVYIALALNKEVFSDYPLEYLKSMIPNQNGGTSAFRIAECTKKYLEK